MNKTLMAMSVAGSTVDPNAPPDSYSLTRSPGMVEALSRLMLTQPFFASLLHWLKLYQTDSPAIPTAATDGYSMWYNAPWYDALPLDERVGVLAHELLHVMFDHMGRSAAYQDQGIGPDFKPWEHDRYNVAADYVINSILQAGSIRLPKSALLDPKIATPDDQADDVYCKVPSPPKRGGGGHGGFDRHLRPPPTQRPRNPAAVKADVAGARQAAREAGNMPAALDRIIGDLLEPVIPWPEKLREFWVRETIGRDTQTYKRLNRRWLTRFPSLPLIYPGRMGFAPVDVVVQIDTSGSIGEKEVTNFLTEVAGIMRDAMPENLHILWVDAEVAGTDHLTHNDSPEILRTLKAKGGGGTDMREGFLWIDENLQQRDIVHIIMTDCYTPWPDEAPEWPVFVLSTTDAESPEWARRENYNQ